MKPYQEALLAMCGGPTSIFPENKSWYKEHVTEIIEQDNYLVGLVGNIQVFSISGCDFWYRAGDFYNLYEKYLNLPETFVFDYS